MGGSMRIIIRRTVCTAGISLCYFANVSQRYGEAKYISVYKSTPTPYTDAGVVFFSCVQYIISVRDSEGNMLGSAHASTIYGI
jgi:hypothetical protein